jgi:hypothetical protein
MMVIASSAPAFVLGRSRSTDRDALEFYARLAESSDPAEVFLPPPKGLRVHRRPTGPLAWARSVGQAETLTFRSPYRVRYPRVRAAFAAHRRNSIARAQHWRHLEGPRPTIIVVHGFMGSPYWLNSGFFALPWFYSHGVDLVLVTLPFHGVRNDRTGPFSGSGLFANGLAHFTEAMLQAVCDLRAIVDYLESTGVEHIGMTGLSLGGYLTALMAAVEPRLHFAVPNAAVTDLPRLIDSWFPAGQLMAAALRRAGIDREVYEASLRIHSPLSWPAQLPHERLYVIGGLGDRLAPPQQSSLLWQHWGRPRLHWYPGTHILHLGRGRYLREFGRFLRDTGFSAG